MRRLSRYPFLVLAFVVWISPVEIAHAANNTEWFSSTITTSTVQYSDSFQHSQCGNQSISSYNYATERISSSYRCVTTTSWGSQTNDGYLLLGGTLSTYYQIDMPQTMEVLFVPGSDRVYFSDRVSSNHFRIGYVTNPKGSMFFNSITHKYNFPQLISYLPGTFSLVGFSTNADYLIDVSQSGDLRRMFLPDLSTVTTPLQSFGIHTTPNYITVSNDGSLILAADTTTATLYGFDECEQSGHSWCPARVLSSTLGDLDYGLESVLIEDGNDEVSIFSKPHRGVLTQVYFSPDIESRDVSYVALGDSYSSGEGTWNYVPGTDGDGDYPEEKCHQGYESYAVEYYGNYRGGMLERGTEDSSREGMKIQTFVRAACSGAKTGDMWQEALSGQDNYAGNFEQFINIIDIDVKYLLRSSAVRSQIPGRALQRDFLAYYQPTFATIGIGGNDVDFGGTIKACLSLSTCPQASSKRAESGKLMQSKFDTLVKTFEDLHNASPSTRLYAVGYPQFIADEHRLCTLNVVLDSTERTFIRESVTYLNAVIKAAAKKAGITYIDIEDSLRGTTLCGNGTISVNGISGGNDIAVPGTSVKVIGQESFHPNSNGYGFIGSSIVQDYGELDTYPNLNCPAVGGGYCPNSSVTAPAVPSYFGTSSRSIVNTTSMMDGIDGITITRVLNILINNLRPASFISGIVYSEPRSLGTFTVGPDGTFERAIQLPEDLEPGYHTIYFSGTLENGESFEYQQVILYAPPGTKTGPCGILPYSNIDQDADGIDDACDPSIDVDAPVTVQDSSTILIYPNPASAAEPESGHEVTYAPKNATGASTSTTDSGNGGDDTTAVKNQPESVDVYEEKIPVQTIKNNSPRTASSSGWQGWLTRFGVFAVIGGCVIGITLLHKRSGKSPR